MVDAMKATVSEEEPNVRVSLDLKLVQEKSLPHFVTSNTMKLFSALDITTETPPSSWHMQNDFLKASDRIKSLSNDYAEHGVALVQNFSGRLTPDEEQLQFLLQVVAEHQKEFPNALKKTMIEDKASQ